LADLLEPLDADLAKAAIAEHADALIRAETAREALRRVEHLAADHADEWGLDRFRLRPPPRLRYPRWGWRKAIRFAFERRMYTPQYLNLYRRYAVHRARAVARRQHIEFQGMTFTGKRVELHARPGHGRLVIGPWCWIGNDNKLRAHEGQLTLGPKCVLGRDNVINTYLDIELGPASLLADWVYVCDFDHRFEDLNVPIKDQGIVKSPVRLDGDVWVGEKATILRGVTIGWGSIVASKALVNTSIPPFSIAVGIPVRVVKSRLPDGMDPDEAFAMVQAGKPIPGDLLGE